MNRRVVLKMLAATSLSDLTASIAASAEVDILELDCVELLARIRDGSLRAEHVCERYLQQYEGQRSLNAVTWIDASRVLARAREIDRARDKGTRLPALAGLPILVKDCIDTVGFPTSAGTVSLKRYFPRSNAHVVERLSEQGAIVMGKANMHELARGVTSSNPVFGFVHNPYDPDVIPGGSSGGCAAAIAARIVPAALGTDTGGSVRLPSAFCGTVGFRPSVYPRKLYSQQGVVPVALDLDTIGPMGRCVADVTMLHAAIIGQRSVRPRSLEGVRIGIPKAPYWNDLDSEVERVAQGALERLRDRGVIFVEVDLREIRDAAWKLFGTLCTAVVQDMESFLRAHMPSVSLLDLTEQIASRDVRAEVEANIRAAAKIAKERGGDSDPALLDARGARRDSICAAYAAVFQQHGIRAIVYPTAPVLPPPIRAEGDDPDQKIEFKGRMVPLWTVVRNTVPAPALGVPALSLPAGLASNGLPVALEFDGLPGDDGALLALGTAVEAVVGRVPRPPGSSHQMQLLESMLSSQSSTLTL